jgi:hypothetical protein
VDAGDVLAGTDVIVVRAHIYNREEEGQWAEGVLSRERRGSSIHPLLGTFRMIMASTVLYGSGVVETSQSTQMRQSALSRELVGPGSG